MGIKMWLAVGMAALASVHAVPAFPAYSQQCQDDAGPPWRDDEQAYHKGSAAEPVLENQACPDPLKSACEQRGDAKTAFLEGPVNCNGKGWYCRILPDPNWPALGLDGDRNFGYCNRSDTDQSGHCHGSDVESTYYWWVRDHWFRQYNGRLKCCCGWNDLPQGRIVNRCDYRRLVTQGTTGSCRDANEGHNLGFEGGCNEQVRQSQFGQEIPEDNSMCWEVQRFGFTEADGQGGGEEGGEGPNGPGVGNPEGSADSHRMHAFMLLLSLLILYVN